MAAPKTFRKITFRQFLAGYRLFCHNTYVEITHEPISREALFAVLHFIWGNSVFFICFLTFPIVWLCYRHLESLGYVAETPGLHND